jgi:P4 family phage/plasmid primase-like protien
MQNMKNKLSVRKLDAVFKMFVFYVPEVPENVDLFSPRNDRANFKDGTLHLIRGNNGDFTLEFKEHNKLDFCTTMIDLNYGDYWHNRDLVNEQWEKWLLEFLDDDSESFKLVQEMFGASLMPKFPQFFVLIGKSGTGKSTTIKVLKQLHKNDKNISGVSPDNFHGFNMTSMIGKLMNIVTDIKTNCRIDDDIVKQVDDQEVTRIQIKGKDDIYTKLPALHIFGANKMPSTSEGYSGAMKRRFSIINFDKVYEGKKNTEIAKDMFSANPLGILAFALRGLERLVKENNGEYTKTSKSQENVENWSKETNVIWQFINELCEDALDFDGRAFKLAKDENESINRATLWKAFKKWQLDALEQRNQIGKMIFFNLLKDNGFISVRRKEGYLVRGIKEQKGDDLSI